MCTWLSSHTWANDLTGLIVPRTPPRDPLCSGPVERMPSDSEDPLRAISSASPDPSAVTSPADPLQLWRRAGRATAGAPPAMRREKAGAWEFWLRIIGPAVFVNTIILLDKPTTLRYSL